MEPLHSYHKAFLASYPYIPLVHSVVTFNEMKSGILNNQAEEAPLPKGQYEEYCKRRGFIPRF